MKYFYILFSLLFVCGGIKAQKNYSVDEVSGNVEVKLASSSTWTKVLLHQELNSTDSVKIKDAGKISIFDGIHSYKFVKTGKFTVYDIRKFVEKQSNNLLKLANEEFRENLASKRGVSSFNRIGTTVRGTQKDSIKAVVLNTIHSIAYHALNDDLEPKDSLIAVRNTAGASTFFTIINNTSSDLYVNILCIDKDLKQVNLLYSNLNSADPCVFLPAGKSINLNMFMFGGIDNHHLILWGSEYFYDTNLVANTIADLNLSVPYDFDYSGVIIGKIIF